MHMFTKERKKEILHMGYVKSNSIANAVEIDIKYLLCEGINFQQIFSVEEYK